jgi:predicted amidophosphoribosyltransferase
LKDFFILFKKISSLFQAYHTQNCKLCHEQQADMICLACENIWFDLANPIHGINARQPLKYSNNHLKKTSEKIQKTSTRCNKCALLLNINHPLYKQKHDFCIDCDHTNFYFDYTFNLFDYIWPIQNLIIEVKSKNLKLLHYLSQKLAQKYLDQHAYLPDQHMHDVKNQLQLPNLIYIIDVPSSSKRISQRGYNPSQIIAKNIEQTFKKNQKKRLPATKKIVRLDLFAIQNASDASNLSNASEGMQKKLNQADRFLNMAKRYQIKDDLFQELLQNTLQYITNQEEALEIKFFLVDDVMTTGATLNLLSHLLRTAFLKYQDIYPKFNISIENLVLARATSTKSSKEVDA